MWIYTGLYVIFKRLSKIEAMDGKVTRKRKSWTSLNFYIYALPFIHFLYFIYARKNYATVEINP